MKCWRRGLQNCDAETRSFSIVYLRKISQSVPRRHLRSCGVAELLLLICFKVLCTRINCQLNKSNKYNLACIHQGLLRGISRYAVSLLLRVNALESSEFPCTPKWRLCSCLSDKPTSQRFPALPQAGPKLPTTPWVQSLLCMRTWDLRNKKRLGRHQMLPSNIQSYELSQ